MKIPGPFWAVLLAVLGVALAISCLFHRTEQNVTLAVLAIASNLVSGALGAFAEHATSMGMNSTPNPTTAALPPEAVVKE